VSESIPEYHASNEAERLFYAALVQYQKACQEQVRALGMMLAAMRKMSEEKESQLVVK